MALLVKTMKKFTVTLMTKGKSFDKTYIYSFIKDILIYTILPVLSVLIKPVQFKNLKLKKMAEIVGFIFCC